jgi:ArsR family metal-binding transcriptional regulator
MLVTRYQTRFVRPPNPSAQHLRCYAQPDGDLSEVLPYLNTLLKGHQFFRDPPSLTLKYSGGTLITLTSHEIAINIVKDQTEAEEILEWLRQEINATWERRGEIVPSFEVATPPRIFEIFKLLPHTNCRACGQPTCMVFAVQVSQGAQGFNDCPHLDQENRRKLQEYLKQFYFLVK